MGEIFLIQKISGRSLNHCSTFSYMLLLLYTVLYRKNSDIMVWREENNYVLTSGGEGSMKRIHTKFSWARV
jgi:hypothetical protein